MKRVALVMVLLASTITLCRCNCPILECKNITSGFQPMNFLQIHGHILPTVGTAMKLKAPKGQSECYVNIGKFIDQFKFDDKGSVVFYGLRCVGYNRIHFRNITSKSHQSDNVMTFLQVEGCKISLSDYDAFANVTKLQHAIVIAQVIMENSTACSENNNDLKYEKCNLLQNAWDIWVQNPKYNTNDNLTFILECQNTFPLIREAIFSKVGWKQLPKKILSLFPNLQTLEITKSRLTMPPAEFPWTDEFIYYERNISRTINTHEQYIKVHDVDIDRNLTRRTFRLDGNLITDLTDFKFHGYLHMISIDNNKLRFVGVHTFEHVRGLQHISMANNEIRKLPKVVFKNLKNLRHLNLQNNNITSLDADIFESLHNLVYLNLANNSLTILKSGLFVNLERLKELHLEFNLLSKVAPSVFPIWSIHLQYIFMNNNPLREFPELVFYLRKLIKVDLRNGQISFDNFTDVLARTSMQYLIESTTETTSSADKDYKKKSEHLRIVDLSNNNITLFKISGNFSKYQIDQLEVILKRFKFVLKDNFLYCDCKILPFSNIIGTLLKNGSFVGNEYFFNDWKCSWPEKHIDQPLLLVKENETYCEKNITDCPYDCTCYERSVSKIIIVDCRNRYLSIFPHSLPSGVLELWFESNNISSLPYLPYLANVTRLYLTNNVIEQIDSKAMEALKNIQILHLNSNMLAGLPQEIRMLDAKEIYLKGNPFKCDCHALWMKSWLLKNINTIKDSTVLACSNDDGEGKQFINVPDEEFICLEEFDSVKHMITPAVACSLSIAIFLSALCALYIYRLEAKVLLYIYFGIHPFDQDDKSGNEEIDVVIIHSTSTTEWVFENVVQFLEQDIRKYLVCEMMRDFVAGFSYQENIAHIVRKSKRMIIMLSKDMMDEDDLVKVAWNEAQEKIRELRTNYVIFLNHEIQRKQLQNKELKRYIKRGRCIDTHDSLFREKILYSMPDSKQNKLDADNVRTFPELREGIQSMYAAPDINTEIDESRLFIAYSDKDIEYTLKHLKPVLENLGHVLYLPDRDFIPGASKEENILRAVDSCVHTLFILSGEHLQDEWSLFTFRCASEKSLREKCNHLIVLMAEDIIMDEMDEEVKYYLKTHVTLKIGNTWYWDRLTRSIPDLPKKEVNDKNEIYVDENVLKENKRNLEMNGIHERNTKEIATKVSEVCFNDCKCEKCKLQKQNKITTEIEMKEIKDTIDETHV